MRRSSAVSGPIQVSLVTMTATASSVGSASGTAQCRHHIDVVIDARSSRPPPSRPSRLFQSANNTSSSLQSHHLPTHGDGGRPTNLAAVWKRTTNGADSKNQYHSRLIGCISGQRSPTSPERDSTVYSTGRLDDLTSDGSNQLRTNRSLPSSTSSLSLENDKPTARRPPPSATPHSSSAPSSSTPRPISSASEAVQRRSSSYRQSSDTSLAVGASRSSTVVVLPEERSSNVEPESKRGRSRETGSKPDRKKRVVSDRSPAALWRSISSSSLVRSLSRRRSNKNIRNSIGHGPEALGDVTTTSDDCPSKMSSSVDTEDSEPDVLEADGRPRRGRRRTVLDSVGGASSDDRPRLEERRQSDAAMVTEGSKSAFRRRSFFSRSFRRSRSTPAEEFVNIAKTNGSTSDCRGKAETERLPRKRMSSRNGMVSTNDVSQSSTLSSRVASWASLKRSMTSDSLSSVNNRGGQHGTTGADVAGVYVAGVMKLFDILVGKWISAMAFNADRRELIVVDFRAAYVIDVSAVSSGGGFRLVRRVVGPKGGSVDRLVEPIGVSAAGGGSTGDVRLVFTDRADQSVKVYSGRGHYIRSVGQLGLSNVGGVAVDSDTGDVFVAGTDSRRVVACRRTVSVGGINGHGRSANNSTTSSKNNRKCQQQEPADSTTKMRDGPLTVPFQHPYSVAVNPVNGDVIVGDDYAQEVVALSSDGRSVRWRWVPPKLSDNHSSDGNDAAPFTSSSSPPPQQRPFFPSSICTDTSGHVFVADLYNERVYMLDGNGGGDKSADDNSSSSCAPPDCSGPLLTKKTGLRGGPLSLAVDESRLLLYVADEERTVRVFSYAAAVTSTTASVRLRAVSDSQDDGEGNDIQRLRLNSLQQQQQQSNGGGSPLPTVDSSFSYCVANVAEEY